MHSKNLLLELEWKNYLFSQLTRLVSAAPFTSERGKTLKNQNIHQKAKDPELNYITYHSFVDDWESTQLLDERISPSFGTGRATTAPLVVNSDRDASLTTNGMRILLDFLWMRLSYLESKSF